MRTLALLLFALTISGCAWSTDSIDVPYEAASTIVPIERANAVTLAVSGTDTREAHRDRVSSKKNGFGMEAAPITATNDIASTVRGGVEQELSRRGFLIGPGAVSIEVSLRHFYNDFKLGFIAGDAVADFDATVTVRSRTGTLVFSQSYSAQGIEANIQLASGDNARAALVRAMAAGVQRIVSDPAFIEAIFRAQSIGQGVPAS